jgi:hypothetical protein
MANEAALTVKPGLIDRAGERVERGLSRILRRLPPRVSLLTGGVFILITLYLPLAVNGCGDFSGPGKDIALGKSPAYWPSLFGTEFKQAGRWFYIFLLACAALTLFLLLLSFAGRIKLTNLPFSRALLAIAGTASFFVLADYTLYFVGGAGRPLGIGSGPYTRPSRGFPS